MKSKSLFVSLLILAVFFVGCKNNTEKPSDEATMTEIESETALESAANEAGESHIPALLQGKWQHTDDLDNILVFDGDKRKEIADGIDEWQEEAFILSDHCQNPTDADNGIPAERDRYITCPESDMCWYIVEIDQEKLSLSYMGRGNTLNYIRVE